jgi:methylmalonyl-CoA/ethylmalonyl-CoA epimerase
MIPIVQEYRFHHLGLAVKRPQKALAFLKAQGYRIVDQVFDPLQRVNLVWCMHATMPAVEVIYQTGAEGPLNAVLAERTESFYHTCYAVEDMGASVENLKQHGLRVVCVSEKKPSVLFAGQAVSFHYIPGFGLIEFVCPIKKKTELKNAQAG